MNIRLELIAAQNRLRELESERAANVRCFHGRSPDRCPFCAAIDRAARKILADEEAAVAAAAAAEARRARSPWRRLMRGLMRVVRR